MEDKLRAYYLPLLEHHGTTARGVGWGAEARQRLRYRVLLDVASGRSHGRTWLEVGCGTGGLLRTTGGRRLKQAGISADTYHGIDALPEMAATATRDFGPQWRFSAATAADVDHASTHVIASGLFALAGWEEMQEEIGALWQVSQMALAFNFLTPSTGRPEPGERTHDRFTVYTHCRTLTPWVTLRADYLPYDATVYMYREARR